MTSPAGVRMSGKSLAGFKVALVHGPSGTALVTEAPKDNGGTGGSFSPTDLVGAALASCALTTMALGAQREALPFGEASALVEKRMTPPPRRIAELLVEITLPASLDGTVRSRLEEIARACPVAKSLHPDVHAPMVFRYE